MQYIAENVDTNKALDYIELCRKEDSRKEYIERVSTESLHKGVRIGLDMAEELFKCKNYEKKSVPADYYDCVRGVIEKIGNLIDVRTDDILKVGRDDKDAIERFAERILAVFNRKEETDHMRVIKKG